MNRLVAFIGALILAFISVSSACTAAPGEQLRFILGPDRTSGEVQVSLRKDRDGKHDNNWSTGFLPSELVGLDLAGFRSPGARPLSFAIVREAGRLDCSGTGGGSYASGNCAFSSDPRFMQLLASQGIGRPDSDQAFALMAVNARRELIDGLAAARYPMPTIEQLTALSALDVSAGYIDALARAGYRPQSIESLVSFKALGITPEWIGSFARIGYVNVPADELVQLKALDITPAFIAGFDRIGYRHLPIDTLVQMKALGVTPEYVQSVAAQGFDNLTPDRLVQMKALGFTPRRR